MKGIVFTEFFEMVQEKFGLKMVDQLISNAQLASEGAYTAVGTYPHQEMIILLKGLSEATQVPTTDLLKTFGQYLFPRFSSGYPHLFKNISNTFEFLSRLDNYIHVEVKKLYPDAELPRFTYQKQGETIHLFYESPRCMSDFAEGLLRGCMTHFNENFEIIKNDLSEGRGTQVEFILNPIPSLS